MEKLIGINGIVGTLKLHVGANKYFTVLGGPFVSRPASFIGVKMAKEIQAPCTINIPTVDFSVPLYNDLDAGLALAVDSILKCRPVYVGCMAGRGRTGLFMAVLAKAFGIENPVEYVRKHYYKHAVETQEQYKFVMDYVIPPKVLRSIRIARFLAFFRWSSNLTHVI